MLIQSDDPAALFLQINLDVSTQAGRLGRILRTTSKQELDRMAVGFGVRAQTTVRAIQGGSLVAVQAHGPTDRVALFERASSTWLRDMGFWGGDAPRLRSLLLRTGYAR